MRIFSNNAQNNSKNIWRISAFLFNFITRVYCQHNINSGSNEQVSERGLQVKAAKTCDLKKHGSARGAGFEI